MAQRAPLRPVSPNRIPPHNLDAEQSVLGAMMESKEAIASVLEILEADDFYKPAHVEIYEAILALFGRGSAPDAITVAEELKRRDSLDRIGGKPYIHGLLEAYPTASSAARYARIVEEHARLRRLVEAGNLVQEIGFSIPEDVDAAVDEAEEIIYQVADRRLRDDVQHIRPLLAQNMEAIEKLYERGESITGLGTGFPDLDEKTSGFQHSNLIMIAARPGMGKSAILNDFALHTALKERKPVVMFNLEMSRDELTKRFLASEARVDSQRLAKGSLQEQDWTRLSAALGRLADAPIYIDDSANVSLMEIRAKCRRIKAKHGLGLVIIDYLQLMQSPKRSENRQQEVSEISRGLKILARELDMPVICACQLNRGVEYRSDKRPLLGDLRESGCLTADTRILRADTGAPVTMGELYESGERNIPVWTLDDDLQMVKGTMTHVFSSGVKKVYEMKLRSGRKVKASANHPFLSFDGWKALEDLKVGERLATPRFLPSEQPASDWPDDKIILLAHLIGDGCFVRNQPLHYTNQDPENLHAVVEAAKAFGVTARVVPQKTWWHAYLPSPHHLTHGRRNPICEWLDGLGLYGKRSREKFVPAEIFGLTPEKISLFLRHLWAPDGHIGVSKSGPAVRVYYASGSRRLIEDVQLLLLRLAIPSRVGVQRKTGYEDVYALHVMGVDAQSDFLGYVGAHGAKDHAAGSAYMRLQDISSNTNLDTVPIGVWTMVRERMADTGVTHREFAAQMGTRYCGTTLFKHAPSRPRLAKAAGILDDARLETLATSHVFWDEIKEIEYIGEEEVFDATVPRTHNFIANGIVAHNSLEQDSDLVMFIYRDEVYNPDSEARGEAELIIAKHRNGPTGVIRLAFMNQYTKFASIARTPGY